MNRVEMVERSYCESWIFMKENPDKKKVILLSFLKILDWPVWLNGWVFLYELSGCGFESSRSDLTLRFCACFKQGVSWHSSNYRVWIQSKMCTWQDKNIEYLAVSSFSVAIKAVLTHSVCNYIFFSALNLIFWENKILKN